MTQSTMCLTALPESIYVYSMCVHGSVCVCVHSNGRFLL